MKSSNRKIPKGSFGYIRNKRFQTTAWTILMFAASLSLFFAGFAATGTKKNLLTVVAVLGILPASKSAVSAFMYIKAKECSPEWKDKFGSLLEQCIPCYDMVFTTYEKSYNVPCLAICAGNVCGLTADKNKDLKELEKHIASCLKKEGHHANVVIFEKEDSFLERLSQMARLEEKETQKDAEIERILFEITL